MSISNMTFPHPVLGIEDSVMGKIEMSEPVISGKTHVYEISLEFTFDNNTLRQLIEEDKAEFICEVNCTNTLYRKIIRSKEPSFTFEVPRKHVKGRVEFVCLLLSKENIYSYSNPDFHPDYDGFSFNLEQGDILAYFGEFYFNADIKYQKLKAVSSFMRVVENEDLEYTFVDLKKDKIEIQMPSDAYNLFQRDFISKERSFVPIVHSSIVLNALLTALYNFEEHRSYLWADVIRYRLETEEQFKTLDVTEKESVPEIAQILLGDPFGRLLNGLNYIVELQNNE